MANNTNYNKLNYPSSRQNEAISINKTPKPLENEKLIDFLLKLKFFPSVGGSFGK
jgi:hypothetical protein